MYKKYLNCQGVITDSRKVFRESIFFALQGPNFNGNAFAVDALARGASYAVIDESKYQQDERYILVENALVALYSLANYHRRKFDIPVIGVTGSCGKTTTKELMCAVLSETYITVATEGNLNTVIGVSLGLLAMKSNTEIAIIEMGASMIGEIAQLCKIAMPTHGLITNIGAAHLEGFGSIEGVLRGKSELYDYLLNNDGQVFVNTADPMLANMAKRFLRPIGYPQTGDFCSSLFIAAAPFVHYKSENGELVNTHLLGKHHIDSIAAALCVAKYFLVPLDKVNQAMKCYLPTNNRMQVIQKESNQILLDAYNANPMSVRSALHTLQQMEATYQVAILADMAELGVAGVKLHQEIVRLTAIGDYQEVILCGPQMITARSYNPIANYFSDKENLINYLSKQKFKNTTILIKGSRFLHLETLVSHIHS